MSFSFTCLVQSGCNQIETLHLLLPQFCLEIFGRRISSSPKSDNHYHQPIKTSSWLLSVYCLVSSINSENVCFAVMIWNFLFNTDLCFGARPQPRRSQTKWVVMTERGEERFLKCFIILQTQNVQPEFPIRYYIIFRNIVWQWHNNDDTEGGMLRGWREKHNLQTLALWFSSYSCVLGGVWIVYWMVVFIILQSCMFAADWMT